MQNSQPTPDDIQNEAEQAAEEAKTTAENKIRQITDNARAQTEARVQQIGGMAQTRIDDQRTRAATRIGEAASMIRERGQNAGPLGVAGEQVALRMDVAAVYLQERQSSEIADDMQSQIRAHPIRAVLMAAVLGFLIGRLLP